MSNIFGVLSVKSNKNSAVSLEKISIINRKTSAFVFISFVPCSYFWYYEKFLSLHATGANSFTNTSLITIRLCCINQTVSGFVSGFKKDSPIKYCAYAVFAFPVPNTFCFSNSSLFVIFIWTSIPQAFQYRRNCGRNWFLFCNKGYLWCLWRKHPCQTQLNYFFKFRQFLTNLYNLIIQVKLNFKSSIFEKKDIPKEFLL